jgi:hypothetical protein
MGDNRRRSRIIPTRASDSGGPSTSSPKAAVCTPTVTWAASGPRDAHATPAAR